MSFSAEKQVEAITYSESCLLGKGSDARKLFEAVRKKVPHVPSSTAWG